MRTSDSLSHYTVVEGDKGPLVLFLCLISPCYHAYKHSLALAHMMVRLPLYAADSPKTSKCRDRHKPTLIPTFLTSITCNHHAPPPGPVSPLEPLRPRFQPGGRWSEHRSFPSSNTEDETKTEISDLLAKASHAEFCLLIVYFKFNMQISEA